MLLTPKQEQTAGPGAVAIQAAGNVTVHGLTATEVKEVCALYMRENFPILREEARQEAERQVRAFGELLASRLVDDAAHIVIDKFARPDVQATVNDAVMAVARRGQEASPDLLATLISERMGAKSSPYRDIVISEAVLVVPKLTTQQLKLLTFVHFIKSVQFPAATIPAIQVMAEGVLQWCRGGFDLSESNKAHIQYAGAGHTLSILGGDIYDAMRAQPTFASWGAATGPAFKDLCVQRVPPYAALLAQFDKEKLISMTLTSVGQAIALAQLSEILPGKIDFDVWLF